ncbi:hypothetical protein GUITHDRAFT_166268 [Guillardia theta CCMP2712]|uniref:Nucleosome assembly protein n=1 Tax=Guillardia theta (strain CCMP2712) TaxID=905079 RepID=L1IDK5_GUITC|nr:hypothetical protein GUITHDRAFT_166268 [Guillardia theta CCMP2712]EKX34192.1 hypothetical protein GUITHDRAFT_166268 [Guillardia theta CCMP2712]|eukprot:XP_005821172.1 hypothetical protein GUITHDRAFT_166268 [Guillardia theta CCMP2712]
MILEGDEEILSYLYDIRATVCENKEGYKLVFKFWPNPYFKNKARGRAHTLEREDTTETVKIGEKPVRLSVSKASAIEWTQRPEFGSKGRKNKKGKGGKGKSKVHEEQEDVQEGEEEAAGEHVKLDYKNSFFALFNPPNLSELTPIKTMVSVEIGSDEEAGLHFIACVDPPTYTCPLGLGLRQEVEDRVQKVLAVQQQLDERRGEFAEHLRKIRTECFTQFQDACAKRRGVIQPMAGEGLPRFWLTVLRNSPALWEVVTDRDERALEHLRDVSYSYNDKRQGMCEPRDTDFLISPDKRGFRVEFLFDKNHYFSDEKLWVELSWRNDRLQAKSSGISWLPEKCLTARKKDIASPGTPPTRYRSSFFLLFEPTKSSGTRNGLFDEQEKLAVAMIFKSEIVPKAVEIFIKDPENDGKVEGEEEESLDSDGEESGEEEEEEEEEEEDDEDEDVQTKIERVQAKRKKKAGAEGMLARMFGNRDPCVMFVFFIMGLNLLIVPLSMFMEH